MCGIAGIYRFDQQTPDPALLATMSQTLHHRGPDAHASCITGPLGMAFRRLAILDTSPAANQPMTTSDGTLTLVFNGELYNFADLRARLPDFPFRTSSDTEVLLAAYHAWGLDALPRLRGMFAFALYDAPNRRLILARDRFGIKPLYYHQNPARLLFASELKALFADPATPNQPNDPRIHDLLRFGYLDHTAETCFASIQQVPPAHLLILTPDQPPRLQRYWALDPHQQLNLPDDVAAAQLRALLDDSVRAHLVSDVPVGSCLSGGIDSSSLVMLVSQALAQGSQARTRLGPRQQTFTAAYNDPRYDERRYSQAIIDQAHVANALVFPDAHGLRDDLEALIWHQEEPCGSTSVYAQWCVMRLARQHGITVLLDGQGADELLAGYPIYHAAWWATLARQGHWRTLRNEIIGYSRRFGSARTARLREAIRLALPERIGQQLGQWIGVGTPAWLGQRLRGPEMKLPAIESPFNDPFRRLLYTFLTSLNLPQLLHYEDRNSMAFSIEARVPFLDHPLVEFIFALPAAQKLRNGETKWILRQAMAGILPESIRTRQDKLGFATPGNDWLRNELAPLADEIFASSTLARRGYIDPTHLWQHWQRHRSGQINDHHQIWRWLHFELWASMFIDQRPTIPR